MAERSGQRPLEPLLGDMETSSEEDDVAEIEYKMETSFESDTEEKFEQECRPQKSPSTAKQKAPQQLKQSPGKTVKVVTLTDCLSDRESVGDMAGRSGQGPLESLLGDMETSSEEEEDDEDVSEREYKMDTSSESDIEDEFEQECTPQKSPSTAKQKAPRQLKQSPGERVKVAMSTDCLSVQESVADMAKRSGKRALEPLLEDKETSDEEDDEDESEREYKMDTSSESDIEDEFEQECTPQKSPSTAKQKAPRQPKQKAPRQPKQKAPRQPKQEAPRQPKQRAPRQPKQSPRERVKVVTLTDCLSDQESVADMAKRSAQRTLEPVLEDIVAGSEEDKDASKLEYKEENDTEDKLCVEHITQKSLKTVKQEASQKPEQRPEEKFMSRNGQLEWSSSPRIAKPYSPTKLNMAPGPTEMAVSRVHDIRSAFELFITNSIQKVVLDMTNCEGNRIFGKQWKTVDEIDLRAYYGILLLAGLYRSKAQAAESMWNAETGRPIFRATMPLAAYTKLSRAVRFDEWETRRERRQKDKLTEIRSVWDQWAELLPLMYNPGSNVTVDERLVGFRGRCPFRQYMPSKPGKYGIKIWAACDAASFYAWNMQIYTGKSKDGIPEKNQGMRVVLDTTRGLGGHNITCDNFFTSYNLGQELLKRKMTMVGTVRHNKAELPSKLVDVKGRDEFSSEFAFTSDTTLVSYVPRKGRNVMLMSTLHRDEQISDREDKKPEIILHYNSTKGGVDTLDKVTGCYSCKRRTLRWPLVVFFNMLDVSAYNAFVIWREINPEWEKKRTHIRRRLFLEELGRALVSPQIQRRTSLPRSPAAQFIAAKIQQTTTETPVARRKLQLPPAPTDAAGGLKRKRCRECPAAKSVKTNIICIKCEKFICKTHTVMLCSACVK